MSDPITLEALRAALGPERPLRAHDAVTSTQDLAREWAFDAASPAPEGAVVVTDYQTAGRGRQGRVWQSGPGESLMFSVVLRPELPPALLPRVTMAGGVAVYEALQPLLGARLALKWPNDILAGGRKLGGLLAEATWLGDRRVVVVLGAGINVRGDFAGTDLAAIATTLEAESGRAIARCDLLADILARLDGWTGRLAGPELVEAWRAALGTLGQRVTVYTVPRQPDSPHFSGVAEGVDDDGALRVRLESGEVRVVRAAEVGLREDGP